ncbi:hypothetical protein VNO80_09914 [Phaseolus coccineus]|uniref:Uncharacterized protein n=1 Tax=Phaseolus coccineus TaxID=3886 RepID=A0AAN9RE66_PHACN
MLVGPCELLEEKKFLLTVVMSMDASFAHENNEWFCSSQYTWDPRLLQKIDAQFVPVSMQNYAHCLVLMFFSF